MGKIEYEVLSSANIQPKRSVVISTCSKGGFTLAQKLEVEEGNKKTGLFLKNAIHVDDLSGMYNLRDALNYAISKIEKS